MVEMKVPTMAEGEQRSAPRISSSGRPVRTIGYLLAGFRADVERNLAQADISSALDAWWWAAEEEEWEMLNHNLEWLRAYFTEGKSLWSLLRQKEEHKKMIRPPTARKIAKGGDGRRKSRGADAPKTSASPHDVYEAFRQKAERQLAEGRTRLSARRLLEALRKEGYRYDMEKISRQSALRLMEDDERFRGVFVIKRPLTG